MGYLLVVHPCSCICIFPYLGQTVKHIAIYYILPESSVKPFDQTVLCRLARLDKLPLYTVLLTPSPHSLSNKLRTIVRTDLVWFASPLQQFLYLSDHPLCRQTGVHRNRKSLPAEIIDDV